MSLYLGRLGRSILKLAVNSSKINNICDRFGGAIKRIDPSYQIGLTREAYFLSLMVKSGDLIEINDGKIFINNYMEALTSFVNNDFKVNAFLVDTKLTRPEDLANQFRGSLLSLQTQNKPFFKFNHINFYSTIALLCGTFGLMDILAKDSSFHFPEMLSFLRGHLGDFSFPTFFASICGLNPLGDSNKARKYFIGASLLFMGLCVQYEFQSWFGFSHPSYEELQDSYGQAQAVMSARTFDWWDIFSYLAGGLTGIFIAKNCVDYSDFNQPGKAFNKSWIGWFSRMIGRIVN